MLGSLLEGTYTQSREIRKVYKLRRKGWIRVNRVEKKKKNNPQRTSVITAKGNGSSNTKKRGQVQYK